MSTLDILETVACKFCTGCPDADSITTGFDPMTNIEHCDCDICEYQKTYFRMKALLEKAEKEEKIDG